MPAPKIAYFDIETAPNLSYVWGRWEQNVIDVKSHWYMLSFSVMWEGKKGIHTYALPDYKNFKIDPEDDSELVKDLWEVFDEADILIAHNGDRFDIRKANARFAKYGLRPPRPYKTIDTLKMARRFFQFDSNKLDHLGAYLGIGRKLPHTGWNLWKGCMAGDAKAWGLMRKYNAQDILLLKRVYDRLKPYMTNHPNFSFFTDTENSCPVCQSKSTRKTGFTHLRTGKRQRHTCNDCGHRFQAGRLLKEVS